MESSAERCSPPVRRTRADRRVRRARGVDAEQGRAVLGQGGPRAWPRVHETSSVPSGSAWPSRWVPRRGPLHVSRRRGHRGAGGKRHGRDVLPATDFSTRQPYPERGRVIDAGATVALATNCTPGSSYTTSMAFCIALAVRDLRMTAEEALAAATLGGARALRRTTSGAWRPVRAPMRSCSPRLLRAPRVSARVPLGRRDPVGRAVWVRSGLRELTRSPVRPGADRRLATRPRPRRRRDETRRPVQAAALHLVRPSIAADAPSAHHVSTPAAHAVRTKPTIRSRTWRSRPSSATRKSRV